MTEPLLALTTALLLRGRLPPGWLGTHAPDGDLRPLWNRCVTPQLLFELAAYTVDRRTLARAACACMRELPHESSAGPWLAVIAATERWTRGELEPADVERAVRAARKTPFTGKHQPGAFAFAWHIAQLAYVGTGAKSAIHFGLRDAAWVIAMAAQIKARTAADLADSDRNWTAYLDGLAAVTTAAG